jgi:hypothetical protein
MNERKYIVKESDLNELLTIISDSKPTTMTIGQIFDIHKRFNMSLVEHIEPSEKNSQLETEPDKIKTVKNGEKH